MRKNRPIGPTSGFRWERFEFSNPSTGHSLAASPLGTSPDTGAEPNPVVTHGGIGHIRLMDEPEELRILLSNHEVQARPQSHNTQSPCSAVFGGESLKVDADASILVVSIELGLRGMT